MTWWQFLLAILIASSIVVATVIAERANTRAKRRVFENRMDVGARRSVKAFSDYTGYPPRLVIPAIRQIASSLEVHPGLLRPQDNLSDIAGQLAGWELHDPFFRLLNLARKTDAQPLETLGDLAIWYMRCRMIRTSGSSGDRHMS